MGYSNKLYRRPVYVISDELKLIKACNFFP